MSSDNNILEKIDLYAKGGLKEEERLAFEKELAANPQLKKQLELSVLVDQMVIVKEALDLKQQMKKDLYKPKFTPGKYVGLALLAFSTAGGWLYFTNREPIQPKVTATADQPTKERPSQKSTESTAVAIPDKSSPTKTVSIPQSAEEKNEQSQATDTPKASELPLETQKTTLPLTPSELPNEDKKEKSLTPVLHVDHCASLQPHVEATVMASCKGDATGEIYLQPESVTGGTPPYHFTVAGKESPSHFTNLEAGQYAVYIVDAQHCRVAGKELIVVPEKVCRTSHTYVFNPEHEHHWRIPYDKEKTPSHIKIHSKNGALFYHAPVVGGNPEEWTGESNTGSVLDIGLYFYTIEYTDKSIEEGSIMITR
ncbi:MAG TPA: gliding motility-associated C-terminal domain-containing protein [Cytophagales bacterium]|nr:gliding motility-associated C-terminal domain-containing protein [Cytophagales bacterium]